MCPFQVAESAKGERPSRIEHRKKASSDSTDKVQSETPARLVYFVVVCFVSLSILVCLCSSIGDRVDAGERRAASGERGQGACCMAICIANESIVRVMCRLICNKISSEQLTQHGH